jgi:hypothetical protein
MTGHRNADKSISLLGMRAQHPVDVEGKGCQIIVSDYPEGHLWYLFEQAEAYPFPAWHRFPKASET